MLISCENCKDVFEVNERHLNSKGVTALCPHCEHKHRVKRIVVPYSLSRDSEEDTEPYDVPDTEAIVVEHLKNETDGNDLEPVETKSDLVFVSKEGAPDINMDGPGGQVELVDNKSYHVNQERRKGQRGTIFDRFVSVDFVYLLIAGILIVGFIVYFSLT